MIVPGLQGPTAVHQFTLDLTQDESVVNLSQRFGFPSGPIYGQVHVHPGVKIGGSTFGGTTFAAITCAGLPLGSIITLLNEGRIGGNGGGGGQGQNAPPSDATFYGGGGGGGAGNRVGVGGIATAPGAPGGDGQSDELGGNGGLSDNGGFPAFREVGYGGEGGDAISIFDIDMDIDNTSGEIWAGGGGGMGGSQGELGNPPIDGGAGGAVATGSAGSQWDAINNPPNQQYMPTPDGNPGFAIRTTTGVASFFPGTEGDVRGAIGV